MSKKFLITGGASGLGLAMAEVCAARSDALWLLDNNPARLKEAKAKLSKDFPDVELHVDVLDVGDSAAWNKLAKKVQKKWGQLDALINNAGIASSGDFVETSDEEWHRVVRVNQDSVHFGTRAMLPLMLPQRAGLIINTASFAGLAGAPDTGVYGVTKAAVVAYSEILRAQLHTHKIHVACLCPSFFPTNLLESFSADAQHQRMQKAAQKLMQQSQIKAKDVAQFALRNAEKGVFLLLPHPETRTHWRMKRWFPERYFHGMLKFLKRT
jgi:short-subunit dehydrogenase